MLISERQLRSIVREMLNESLGSGSGSSGPVTSGVKKGKGGYEYEIFSNGKIQIVRKGGKKLATPKVLNQAQAMAVAQELKDLGNKGTLLVSIADGTLVFTPAAVPAKPAAGTAVPAAAAGAAPQKGVILIGRQDYPALKMVSAAASATPVSRFTLTAARAVL